MTVGNFYELTLVRTPDLERDKNKHLYRENNSNMNIYGAIAMYHGTLKALSVDCLHSNPIR